MFFYHLLLYCVTLVRIQCNAPVVWLLHCIWHTVSEMSERLQSPTGIWCTQHMVFWALRERPMHYLMTDQCRPSGLDQRALRCVLVREREIHRKIRSNLTVLNLTSVLKPVDTISRTAQEKKERKNAPAVAVKNALMLL